VVFVVDILDVDGDSVADKGPLMAAIRTLKRSTEVKVEMEYRKEPFSSADYQGDAIAPWENPFQVALQGPLQASRRKGETEELQTQLEDAIFSYILAHEDAIRARTTSNDLSDAKAHANEASARLELLRKKQAAVERRFEKTVIVPVSIRPKDYLYTSVLVDSRLTVPPTPSNLAQGIGEKIGAKVGGVFSSVVGSVFGSSSKSKTFATIADTSKKPKSKSARLLEDVLQSLGYVRHGEHGTLPFWLLAFGRKCPSEAVLKSKDPSDAKHILICAAFTAEPKRTVLLASRTNSEEAIGQEEILFRQFYRFYDQEDAKFLQELDSGTALVFQGMGSGKPQLLKVTSIPKLLGNEKLTDSKLGIVAAQLPENIMLWHENNRAFMVRSWVIIERGNPALLASFFAGDVIVSDVEYETFQGKEATETTARMRFPAYAESPARILPVEQNLENLPAQFLKHLKMIATAATGRIAKQEIADAANLFRVQHICMDFVLDSKALVPTLLTFDANCDLTKTSQQTQREILSVALSHVANEGRLNHDHVIIDRESGFAFN